VWIEFDGVMAASDIWINGFHLGRRPYGYVSFSYELTGHLNFGPGRDNVIAVRADNSAQPASRWYTGAGIYRHVRLVVTNQVHLEHWSTFVTTPKLATDEATVHISGSVMNQSVSPRNTVLDITVRAPDGKTTKAAAGPRTILPGTAASFAQDVVIPRPALWDLDHPSLYEALVQVRADANVLDEQALTFGIREFRFEAATGFWLNGKNLKLKGVCLHHDGGAVGAAVPVGVWEYRLQRLKQIGVNAIRTAHNPAAPEFLDMTDRMGFVVLDEMFDVWTVAKTPYDYHLHFRDWSEADTSDTVRRDRNHPSVGAYSAGNEIHDTPNAELSKNILRSLLDVFHREDPSRPVTQGLFRPNVSRDYENGLADMLDVVGQNYRENEILAAHRSNPGRKILGTENRHEREVWLALRDNPPYAGQFVWAGIDYLGESQGWPAISADFGLLDRAGGFKPRAWERQSWWSAEPMVHIVRRAGTTTAAVSQDGAPSRQNQTLFSDWTPRDQSAHTEQVEVYSNCEQVDLALKGKSLGSKMRPADDAPRIWQVPFEAGRIRASCRNGGQVAATHELRTAGPPAKISLSANRTRLAPVWDDVAFVTARVVDENGTMVPEADQPISFQTAGQGITLAVDNADLNSHDPFQASTRRAFQGWCVALVRATGSGRIALTASSPGLASSSLTLEAK
jgi:beta-galactosidase